MQSYAAGIVLCLILAGLSVGCNAPSPEQAQRTSMETLGDSLRATNSVPAAADGSLQTTEDSLFAFLRQIDADPVLNAFADLPGHIRYVRTEQFSREGNRIAYRERILNVDGDLFAVKSRDSSGVFDYGYLRAFSSGAASEVDLENVAENIIPEDPAYLSPRNREAFSYRRMRGSLPGYGEVGVIDIRARPELGSDQSIRRARLYVPDGTAQLVAFQVERREGALWFREWSDLFLSVQQIAGGAWLPRHVRAETLLRMPFRPLQRFRTVSTFYGFDESP